MMSTSLRLLIVGAASIFLLSACQVSVPDSDYNDPSLSFLQKVEAANNLMKDWLVRSVNDKGLFLYEYDPITDKAPNKNNAIRQLMASRRLAYMTAQDSKLLDLHRRNLDFVFKFWYREDDDKSYIFYNDKSKLGANAMMLHTLSASPDFDLYQTQARQLANGIVSLIQTDNSLLPWYIEPGYDYDADYLLTFYSGEALLALVTYGQKIDDQELLDKAIAVQDFYIDQYVTKLAQNYYPAYVPWHSQSLNLLYKQTGDQKYADAIFTLNDELLKIQDTTQFIGRFYDPDFKQYGSPHSSSDGVYTEGVAYAYEIAKLTGDTQRQQRYLEAIKLGVENILSLQYTEVNTGNAIVDPDKVKGAIRIRADRFTIRTDTTQHSIDAFTKILEVVGD